MSSSGQAFLSTPTFEIFRRGLITQTIKRFRGINVFQNVAVLGPEWAQDCRNVIVSGSGGLSKMRLPVALSAVIPNQASLKSFWDFQQGNGTRQTLGHFGNALYYFTNDFANVTLIESNPLNAGQWSFGAANQILFGVNGTRAMKWTGSAWQLTGIVAPANAPAAPGVIAGNLSPSRGGYTYGYAWKNSATTHCGNISPVSPSTGNQNNSQFTVVGTAPTDPQADTIVWFRALDGGGDQYRLAEVNINTGVVTNATSGTLVTVTGGTGNLGITDNTPDSGLDQTVRGPLINTPPLIGKYLAVGQGRVFIFNLNGASQDFIYSGYEQIPFGRPEESFPPGNRIRMSIGAEAIGGGGVLQVGVVAFSQTGRMFMVRGSLEDIVTTQPANFYDYMEELPWTLGCLSHFTIQSTPFGLIWLAGDKTVQLFDGASAPVDLSEPIYPLLRQITPGQEGNCVAGYFNWLERDWYVLACAVSGSLTLNRLFFFALNAKTEEIEIFVSDIQADWVGLVVSSKLQRQLCISQNGQIKNLPVVSDTVGGLTQDLTINPATAGNLSAYWRSGYFGNDAPQRNKTFRFLRMITDQDPKAFKATMRYVDDDQRTLLNPEIIGPVKLATSRLGLNRKAKRLSAEINFPQQDAPANVVELQMAHIATGDK